MTVTPRYLEPSARRRGPRRRRGLPLRSVGLGLLVGVAVAGAAAFVLGRVGNGDERKVVERFGAAWADGDYGTMYDQLDADSRRRVSLAAFTRAYRTADLTGTTTRISTSKPDKDGDTWKLPVKVRTRAFGLVTGNVRIPVGGDPPRLRWSPELTFPGLRDGERLHRVTRAARRAPLLARNGRTLADRDGVPTSVGAQTGITGEVGQARGARLIALVSQGFPANARVGRLRAAEGARRGAARHARRDAARGKARARPHPAAAGAGRAHDDRPRISQAAAERARRPLRRHRGHPPAHRRGARAGRDRASRRPAAGLDVQDHHARRRRWRPASPSASRYPVQTAATLEGVELENANGESCGGYARPSPSRSPATRSSPRSAPSSARDRLVARPSASASTSRPASRRGRRHDPRGRRDRRRPRVGSTPIGQGKVQATPLQMAVVGGDDRQARRAGRS